MLPRIGFVVLIVGGVLVFLGIQEWRVGRTASATPEEISLRDLIARGPEGNPNIILKDFQLCDDFVYETKRSRWEKVWVPVVPAVQGPRGGPVARPTEIKALIVSTHVRSKEEIDQRCNKPKLPALVTNKIVSLGSKEKKLLQESYPGTNFDTCLIIEEGRAPASSLKLGIFLGGGIILVLAGGGMLLFHFLGGRGASAPVRKKRKRRREEEDEEEDDEEEEEEERPRRRRVVDEEDEEEPRPRRRRDEDDEDDRPRRPRRRPVDD